MPARTSPTLALAVAALLLPALPGCASSRSTEKSSAASSADQAIELCVDLARFSFQCADEFVDARLRAEASGGSTAYRQPVDSEARQQLRADRLRQLRTEQTEPLNELRSRCAASVERGPAFPPSARTTLEECDLKAACTLKVECLRPLLVARFGRPG